MASFQPLTTANSNRLPGGTAGDVRLPGRLVLTVLFTMFVLGLPAQVRSPACIPSAPVEEETEIPVELVSHCERASELRGPTRERSWTLDRQQCRVFSPASPPPPVGHRLPNGHTAPRLC